MVFFFFPHDLVQIVLGYIVVFSQIFFQIFGSPVVEGTTMMFLFFGGRSSDNVSAVLGSFGLTFSYKTIGVFNIVHVRFEIGCWYFANKRSVKELFVVMDVHAASFEEEPQLTSPFMFQMVVLFEFCGEVEHTGREKSFPKALYIFYG